MAGRAGHVRGWSFALAPQEVGVAIWRRFGGALGLALGALVFLHLPAHATVHRAALLVEHSSSWPGARVLWRCVEFSQEAISGLTLLELAGVNSGQPPQVYDWGGGALTVCQINGEPPQVPDRCFGPVLGPNWSDWSWSNGGWSQRSVGVTGYTVRDGDLEGWTYSSGFGMPPGKATFGEVCPTLALATPHGTATAVGTPSPRASTTSAPELPVTAASPLAAPASVAPATHTSGLTPAYLLFGGSLIFFAGLLLWNLLRRAP